MADLDNLREAFKSAVARLPDYKRTDAWSYVAALELRIQAKDKEIQQLAEAYDKAHDDGYDEGQRDADIAATLERYDREES